MQTENRFLDDLARVASGAFGALAGVRSEIEEMIKQRLARLLAEADLVPRDEFETVREMAVKAREEQDALAARVAALEDALAGRKATPKRTPRKSGTSKSAAARSAGKRRSTGKGVNES